MAIAYQSVKNGSNTSGTDIQVDKPVDTAAGDFLLAILVCADNTASFTGLDGFTSILETAGSGSLVTRLAYKIATGSEGANFTFSTNANGSGDRKSASIARFTGTRQVSVISASSGQANASSTTVTAPTVTPVEANSMLVFVSTTGGGTAVTTNYTVAVSNPSWTAIEAANNISVSIDFGYATRPEVTATGAGTATIDSSLANIGQLVVISEMPSFTVSDTTTATDTTTFNLGIIISEVITATEIGATAVKTLFRNLAKSVSSWINQDKS